MPVTEQSKRFKQYVVRSSTNKIISESKVYDITTSTWLDEVFTLEEAKRSQQFSNAVLKRMEKLRPGTMLYAGYQSRETDVVVMVFEETGLDGEILKLEGEIDILTEQIRQIAGDLMSKKAKLAKQLLKTRELNMKQKSKKK